MPVHLWRRLTWLPLLLCPLLSALVALLAREGAGLELEVTNPPALPHSTQTLVPTFPVKGRVSPAAEVEVLVNGVRVPAPSAAAQGDFQVSVPLEPGFNRIDVKAKWERLAGWWQEQTTLLPRGVFYSPDPPPAPALDPLPAAVNRPDLVVQGKAAPGADVTILIDKQQQPPVQAGPDGRFRQAVRLPGPGTYTVSAQAGPGRLPGAPVAAPRKGPAAAPAEVFYAPNALPRGAAVTATRSLTVTLSLRALTVQAEATLPQDDSRVRDLAAGRLDFPHFLVRVFPDVLIGDQIGGQIRGVPLSMLFDGAHPEVSTADGKTTVRAAPAAGRSLRPPTIPLFDGDLTVAGLRSFPAAPGDTLTIAAADYTLLPAGPAPSRAERRRVTWTGGERGFEGERLAVRFTYDAGGQSLGLLQFLQLSPFQYLPYYLFGLPYLLLGFLNALPLVWGLWLLERERAGGAFDAPTADRFAGWARWLIALCFLAPALQLSQDAANLLFYLEPVRDFLLGRGRLVASNTPALRLAGALLLSAFVGGLLLAARRVRRAGPRLWLVATLWGLLGALLMSLVLHGTAWLLAALLPPGVTGYRVFLLLALLPLGVPLVVAAADWSGLLWPARVWPVALAACLGLLLPVLFGSAFGSSFGPPSVSDTLHYNGLVFAGAVGRLVPVVALLGIVPLLRGVTNRDQTAAGGKAAGLILPGDCTEPALSVGALLFGIYLVGTQDAWWAVVPVPFLLALLAYRRLVVKPPCQRLALDVLTPAVCRDRAALIEHAVRAEEARQLEAGLEKLKNKVLAGELSLGEAEKRQAEIRGRVDSQGGEVELGPGLKKRHAALEVGPWEGNWQNACWSARCGLLILLPLGLVYAAAVVPPLLQRGNPFPLLTLVADGALLIGTGLGSAFFFGYFFPYLRGTSGLAKGMGVGLVALGCPAPVWLVLAVTGEEVTALLLHGALIFLFFAGLGVLAFDATTLRRTLGEQFRWGKLARFGGVWRSAGFATVLLASTSVTLTSVLSGQFTTLAAALAKSVVPAPAAQGAPPGQPRQGG